MKHFPFSRVGQSGRPPKVELTGEHVTALQSLYLASNRTRKEGSMEGAWVDFVELCAPEFGFTVRNHRLVGALPTVAREVMLRARALVGVKRGGGRRLLTESGYVPGTMRLVEDLSRRLLAGEQFSVDDATRNVPCWVPWPWGGCPTSEKWGVKLGRWQTLLVHDDASGYVPAVHSVFRPAQSYNGVDAASVILQTEVEQVMPAVWVVEGGVWQGGRVMEILEGRYYSAQGRPNQKLVEGYFTRLWTRMSSQCGDVGRYQAEMRANSQMYVKARNGQLDPRKVFLSLDVAQEALEEAIRYLNSREIRSREYGVWVPEERWAVDLEAHPREARRREDAWMLSPVREVRVVRRQTVSVTAVGPRGDVMEWRFSAPWLAGYERRRVAIYFDPLSQVWPVEAVVTAEGSTRILGMARCMNPVPGVGRVDESAAMANAVRKSMLAEFRTIHPGRERGVSILEVRTPEMAASRRAVAGSTAAMDEGVVGGLLGGDTSRSGGVEAEGRPSVLPRPAVVPPSTVVPPQAVVPPSTVGRDAISEMLRRRTERMRAEGRARNF